ncbi:MAG: hypothetical protein ACFCVB_12635 [Nodosilinea sp.]
MHYSQAAAGLSCVGQDEASFCQNAHPYNFTAFHAAISVPVSQAKIKAIAQREG